MVQERSPLKWLKKVCKLLPGAREIGLKLLDQVFPSFCKGCQVQIRSFLFCADCWLHLKPLDPKERCIHCFQATSSSFSLCSQCKVGPSLPLTQAYVFDSVGISRGLLQQEASSFFGYFLFLWSELPWPAPDCVVALYKAEPLGQSLAEYFNSSYITWNEHFDPEMILEDQTLLLVGLHTVHEQLQRALISLGATFPKRIYGLSLMHGDLEFTGSFFDSHPDVSRGTYRAPARRMDCSAPGTISEETRPWF